MAQKPKSEVSKWLEIISGYDNEFKKWEARVAKILKRYRDDNRSQSGNDTAKFNILWANVKTLIPAVYARLPRADVSRRFADNDPIGRVASLLLERALDYEIEHYTDYRSCMRHSVEDRFLSGRGVGWVRYDPHVKQQDIPEDGLELTDSAEAEGPEDKTAGQDNPPEEIAYECSPADYVNWKDFGHSKARTWEEVEQVWRWVYLTDEAGKERFGKTWKGVPLDSGPEPLNKYLAKGEGNDRAKICELWDQVSGKVYWFSKNCDKMLDERDDPLELEGFFPCARPLYATTTSDNLVPVPDFVLYQDQANELDLLSDRIDGLVKALRVRGIYDASQPALQRLLTEGDNNTLIPTDKWAAFSEKGGLKGTIDLLPLDIIATALLQCYQARQDIKGQIYEITGISDIIRGETAASETATAQNIKGQYAGLRLKSMQEEVALFASDLLKIMAQIICTKYQPTTILKYAGADQLADADKALIPQALQLLKQDPLQSFRIEVAADSLVQIDEQQNKQDRLDFLNAFTNFLREAVPAGQSTPELVPMIMESIKYGVAGFKAARTIEGTIDAALEQLKAKAAEMKANPQPTKEQQQAQADQQMEQAKGQMQLQIAQVKTDAEAKSAQQVAQVQAQADQARMNMEEEMKMREMFMNQQFQKWEAKLKADTQVLVAKISAGVPADVPDTQAELSASENFSQALNDGLSNLHQQLAQHIASSHALMANQHAQSMAQVAQAIHHVAGPKEIIRGPDGRAIGTRPMTMQ